MWKRTRGRGVRPSDKLLSRRILSTNLGISNVEQIVEHLRGHYPEYRRTKQQLFTEHVAEILEFHKREKRNLSPSSVDAVDDGGGDDASVNSFRCPSRRKRKKFEVGEERLLRAESEYVCRKNKRRIPSPSSSSSEEEEEDGAISTSDDAIFEAKVEPEFDVTKSMLRMNYSASKPANEVKKAKEEANVEVEVVEKARKIELLEEANVEVEVVEKARKIELLEEANVEVEVVEKARKIELLDEAKKGFKRLESKAGGSSNGDFEIKKRDGPRFRDLGGMRSVLDELMMEVIVPLCHPQLPRWLGVRPMAGILLHGPPGCGKTKLAHAIANETGVPFYKISATEVVSGVSGASEENIRDLFAKAYRTAPSIVFIDEIDAIASKRENLQREMERRIVTQLMTCMEESHQNLGSIDEDSESPDGKPGYVLVIGATNRPDAVDPALRRPGRFDREIVLGVPDENARVEILSVLTKNLRLEGAFDLIRIARASPGFVGADLAALANKAGNLAMKRIIDRRKSVLSADLMDNEKKGDWWRQPWVPEEMESLRITMADFEEAAKIVQPSSRREGFSSIPNIKWDDVGGLSSLRREFENYIVRRIKQPEVYEEFGVDMETGFLLYGPPGCGKTLIAKAVANEAGANFIHIKGPELLNKYVGESELAVRTIFSRARTCAPCILFFDEADLLVMGCEVRIISTRLGEALVDALTTKRGKEGGWVVERLLNQLLIELDGADHRRGIYVIGATNRPEVMDPAVLRPGRFGKLLYVPLPDGNERVLILKSLARNKPLAAEIDLNAIGQSKACENLSGADLAAVMNEAAMVALEEQITESEGSSDMRLRVIMASHFEQALKKISPSVSNKQARAKAVGKAFEKGGMENHMRLILYVTRVFIPFAGPLPISA
ncbi:hypothetical protein ACLOJK_009421 [Asimina triloba]